MESSKEMLDELEQMPMTQFVRKYGHLTFNGIYELLEQQADLLRRAVEVVKDLNQLIRNSQDVLSIYLQPDGDADMAIDHLLYLLDGPEQRVIQTKAQALLKDLEEAREGVEV